MQEMRHHLLPVSVHGMKSGSSFPRQKHQKDVIVHGIKMQQCLKVSHNTKGCEVPQLDGTGKC